MSADGECLPFRMEHVPERFYLKARQELNETPDKREQELNKLRDLLSADKCTSGIEFEVDFLHQFLRHSKYNSSKAHKFLLKFLKLRRNYSSMFQSVSDELFKSTSQTQFLSVLPLRSLDGCAIFLAELGKWNPNKLSFEDLKRIAVLTCIQTLRCPISQINGYKAIFDFKDSFKHLKYCTPQNISLLYMVGLNSLPARCKEFHCIHKSVLLTAIWSVLKHCLPEKLRKRVFFHSNPEELLNYFPRSVLPTQYGGSLIKYRDSELIRKFNKQHENYPQGGMPNFF